MTDTPETPSAHPVFGDFSKGATNKAVLKNTLSHPATLYPLAIGMLSGLGVLLFSVPAAVLVASLSGLGLGLGAWVVNYFVRKNSFASRYIQNLQHQFEEQRKAIIAKLDQELHEEQSVKGMKDFASQAEKQFHKIHERLENLKEVLAAKIPAKELTYNRYAGTAEQVYVSVLDNLQTIVALLKSCGGIDEAYIHEKCEALKNIETLTQTNQEELATLEKRLGLKQNQIEQISALLTNNEKALTQIDQTTAALASAKIVHGRPTADLEVAIGDLQDLAKRASKLGSN